MSELLPFSKHSINISDAYSILRALYSGTLASGKRVLKFEEQIARATESEHVHVVNSATSALHLAYLTAGVSKGDEVWVPATTFVATANAALYCGASVRLLDICLETGLVDVDLACRELVASSSAGTLPKVIVVVYLQGHSVNIEKLASYCKEFNVKLIEDASHALGARYPNGKFVGSDRRVFASVFSFHPVKMITTGEGGAVIYQRSESLAKSRLLANQGVSRTGFYPWQTSVVCGGYNYRMSEISASLGLSQIKRLDKFINKRKAIAVALREGLHEFEPAFRPLFKDPSVDLRSSHHLTIFLCNSEQLRDHLRMELYNEKKIATQLHYRSLSSLDGFDSQKYTVPNSLEVEKRALTLPNFCNLKHSQLKYVIESVGSILQNVKNRR